MENLFDVLGLLVAAGVLLNLAFPGLILPEPKNKTKRVGSTYWGVYEGRPVQEPEGMRTIEVETPARKERVVAGSQMYAAGRGTSFRQ